MGSYEEASGRHFKNFARTGPFGHASVNVHGGAEGKDGFGHNHHPERQHQLALSVPVGQYHPLAIEGDHPGATKQRLSRSDRRSQQYGGDRCVQGGRLNRLTPIYQEYGIPELYNFRPRDVTWQIYRPKAKMRVLNRIYPDGISIPELFHGKNILHLPTVKCHIYTTTTGSMKNAFGGLLNRRRHYTHSAIHETLVDLLAIQKEIHRGIFTVMDGTICGNGPGPRTMIPVEKNLLLAGSDSVAVDAVAAKIMGFNPMKIDYIKMAHEDGLGVGNIREIDVKGEDIEPMNFGFHVGDNFASHFGDLFWFSPLKRIQKLFFHTPLVYPFIFGSYLYHDCIWWPLVGKRIMEVFKANSPWGRFFETFPLTSSKASIIIDNHCER
jgi:hypothetical protein